LAGFKDKRESVTQQQQGIERTVAELIRQKEELDTLTEETRASLARERELGEKEQVLLTKERSAVQVAKAKLTTVAKEQKERAEKLLKLEAELEKRRLDLKKKRESILQLLAQQRKREGSDPDT